MHLSEYLGYIIGRNGIAPIPKKVDAILKIAEPKNKKELKRFLGMINFYKDFWIRRLRNPSLPNRVDHQQKGI